MRSLSLLFVILFQFDTSFCVTQLSQQCDCSYTSTILTSSSLSTSPCTTWTPTSEPPCTSGVSSASPPNATPSSPCLYDALIAANCSQFLAFILSDPVLRDAVNSDDVRTLFAPSDSYFSFDGIVGRNLLARQEVPTAKLTPQISGTDTSNCYDGPLKNYSKNKDGSNQTIVPDNPDCGSNTTALSSSRTELSPTTGAITTGFRRWFPRSAKVDYSIMRLASGLGNRVDVIDKREFNHGMIQVTNGLFTLPTVLSDTAAQRQLTTFNSIVAEANLTDFLDNKSAVTAFIPRNEAFENSGGHCGCGDNSSASVVGRHIVIDQDNVGYTPNLKDGQMLTTINGERLTVCVQGQDYFINGAKITLSNMVTDTGVAHIIDKVITPPVKSEKPPIG